uniref:Uncharacterized protein n=1 Tax=Buteo japonicus TaxID=224669 RepID=A0A8B9ZBH5_9AVES
SDIGQLISSPPISSIIGVIGESVVLPCHVVADNIPEVFSVQWIFHEQSQKITVSRYDGKNKMEKQDERYQGRTEFFHSEFRAGNMSLHLKNVRSSDKGSYACVVSFNDTYHDVLIELHVAGYHMKQGISLTCHAVGWFPKPEVIWLDGQGHVRKELSTTKMTMMPAGLYSVVTSMNLNPGSDMEVACRIVNNLLNTTSESRVLISDIFFPSISKWLITFLVILCLSMVLISTVFSKLRSKYFFVCSFSQHREISKQFILKSVTVTKLQVPGTPDVESSASEPAGPNAPSTVPVLLGKEGFAAGKHYWEVEVGQQHDWVLGVLREKGREEEEGTLPGEDFWALHRSQGEIFSSKGDHRIAKQQMSNSVIGVLLDLEEGQVNFYDAEQMGVMVRMPLRLGKEPAEMFYPFLSKREGTLTPLIRPVLTPVPLKLLEI